MALHPVGPLAPATYWRRRAVLGLALLALLLLLRACTGGSPDPAPSAQTLTAPRPSATRTPAATPTTARSATPAPSPATTGGVAGCADDALVLVSSADAPSYAVGARPVLVLTVRNGGTAPCRRDLGGAAVELQVVSGRDRVWSSDDCSAGSSDPVVLAPGQTRTTRLVWAGRRSAPGCSGTKDAVTAGTYRVRARVGTLSRDGGTFTVR